VGGGGGEKKKNAAVGQRSKVAKHDGGGGQRGRERFTTMDPESPGTRNGCKQVGRIAGIAGAPGRTVRGTGLR